MAAVGAMVGAAIFLLVGATYTVAGPFVLLSLAIAALVAMLAGMSYAELASGRPDASGGAYVWVRSALPSPSGFLSGWLSWGAHMAATSLGALGLGVFLLELIQPFSVESFFGPNPIQVGFVALGVLGLSAVLHFARIHLPVRALGRLTLAKLLLIVVLAAVGLASVLPANPLPPAAASPNSLDLVLGAGVLFIAFQGFEVVAQLGDQAKRPELTVPRAMFVALLLSSLVYAAFLVAILGNAPPGAVAGWPICDACRGGSEDIFLASIRNSSLLGQPVIRVVFLLVGIVSMYGALNAHLSSAIKTSFSLARDRLLPAVFARIRGREVPPAAVAFTVLGAGVLVFLTVETIAVLASLAFLSLFAFVHASVIALRRRERRSGPGFRVPFVPAVPMLAIALNLALGATLWNFPAMADSPIPPGELAVGLGGLWLAIGLAYHWFVGRRGPRPSPGPAAVTEVHDILTTGEERVELERYRVFLPLREFEDRTLVDLGARVARRADRRRPAGAREQHRLPDRERALRCDRVQNPGMAAPAPADRHPHERDLEPGRRRRPRTPPRGRRLSDHRGRLPGERSRRGGAAEARQCAFRGTRPGARRVRRTEGRLFHPLGIRGVAGERRGVAVDDSRHVPGRAPQVRVGSGRGSNRQARQVPGPHPTEGGLALSGAGDSSRSGLRDSHAIWAAARSMTTARIPVTSASLVRCKSATPTATPPTPTPPMTAPRRTARGVACPSCRCFQRPANCCGTETRELIVPATLAGSPKIRIRAGMRYSPPATPRRPETTPIPKPVSKASAACSAPNEDGPGFVDSNRRRRSAVAARIPERKILSHLAGVRRARSAPAYAPGTEVTIIVATRSNASLP